MSEPISPTPTPKSGGTFSFARVMLIVLPAVAIAAAFYAVVSAQNQLPTEPSLSAALEPYLKQQNQSAKLASEYTDADGDLVADAPTDAAKLQDPAELVFAVVPGDDPIQAEKLWRPLMDAVAKSTGKKVVYIPSPPPAPPEPSEPGSEAPSDPPPPSGPTLEEQLLALKNGKLHICAFSTGQVPTAVNTAGFIPQFSPADDQGKFAYEMEVIVPASSPVKDVSELKGKKIGFSTLSSNSGAKAPLVLFKEKFGMLPGRDYPFTVTGSHVISIYSVCIGERAGPYLASANVSAESKEKMRKNPGEKLPAACVANDLLGQMLARGDVLPDQFRSIYKSEPFPPLCFGVAHNLDPKLRAAIESAFANFQFTGTPIGDRYKAQGRTKFAPVTYEKDWKTVRDIDEKLTHLLDPAK